MLRLIVANIVENVLELKEAIIVVTRRQCIHVWQIFNPKINAANLFLKIATAKLILSG
jgi:hypothetical protein